MKAETGRGVVPPVFLELAAHPVRWRVLDALGASDRTVSELCRLLGCRQSLVSYHLACLRHEGIVRRRRSSADGRESYYILDLTRCGELLAASAETLHPGLRFESRLPRRSASAGTRVLFLCTGNSARSQIAQALVEQLTDGRVEALSAGSHPKSLHPNAVRVMRERGIDIAGRRSKHLSEFAGERFDAVVSLCDRVREVCPEFPGHPDLIHWSVRDPAREGTTDAETYVAFERTAGELAARIPFLLELIEHARVQQAGR
jgi:protein-tyrosine-phosphatase/DNA-binding transcriptional ArsR family regulator